MRKKNRIKHGILKQSLCFEDVKGRRTRVGSERRVSMRHKHLAAMRTTWQAENWSGQLEVRSFLDGDLTNSGVKRYENLNNDHLETVGGTSFCPHCLFLKCRTNQSLVDISLAARHLVSSRGRALPSRHTMDLDIGVPARGWHGEAYRGHIFWDELFIFPLFNLRMPDSRSWASWGLMSTTTAIRIPTSPGCTTTPTPT
ncbi:MAG: glycoside hydrolase family 65 protein [Desulfohalobiaceae bacterium]|nr:glycoside hydrolase family 65 protein [Desulfohalobiaceae bacterium]